MVDRPIIFSGPMVRALLAGRKTQTRRLLSGAPAGDGWHCDPDSRSASGFRFVASGGTPSLPCVVRYAAGDRLYVRESWSHTADGVFEIAQARLMGRSGVIYQADDNPRWPHAKYWPSIHMPREFSRLTLTVEDVRIERLQAIEGQHPSESDALAEGVHRIHHGDGEYYYHALRDEPHPQNWSDPADAFRELWNSLHGPGAWATNPFVVVLTFSVALGNIDQQVRKA